MRERVPVVKENEIHYMNCESSGLFVSHKNLLDHVREGEVIGTITNPLLGAVEEEIVAPIEGIIMTLREHPGVAEGSLVARIIGGSHL